MKNAQSGKTDSQGSATEVGASGGGIYASMKVIISAIDWTNDAYVFEYL
jgi:hypothetical protein